MTEILVNSRGCDWYAAITQTGTTCWLAQLKEIAPDTVVVRASDDPADLGELLASAGGWKH
jgi:hypothetical protein